VEKRIILITIICLAFCLNGFSSEIIGTVKDADNNELMIGATIYIKELKMGISSGLDGSYHFKNIPKGKYTVVCSFISYNKVEKTISISNENEKTKLNYSLSPSVNQMKEVIVEAHRDKSTEISARESERTSPNLMNVVSAKSIELSPDQDVASVVQRMSGVTLDKSSSGSGQYALLRGMDKRYSYTLVNGIQMPSTNNNQRYVSLDIFPSDLVDRVEVTKALTPDMEGDAIAGAINLIMKNAPNKFILQTNVAVGYSNMWFDNKFLTFNNSDINSKSPYELNGSKYIAKPSDFPKSNLDQQVVNFPLNKTAGITIGDRFFNKRLGWILAASYNETYKGTHSLIFGEDQSQDGKNLPVVSSMQQRMDYDHQQNYGVHSKLDFTISQNHSIQLYMAYMNFNLMQVRDIESTELGNNSYDPTHGGENLTHSDENRLNIQSLLNTTLQGDHKITNHFSIQWSAVYSKATNQSPDNSTITYDKTYINYVLQPQDVDFGGSDRLWLHNSDEDKAGYLNLKYNCELFDGKLELKTGALYRDKKRTSFYNDYTLISRGPVDAHSAKDIDWINYSDINWTIKDPLGAVNTPGTYNAYETVKAEYGMFSYEIYKLHLTGGARYEDTRQGYDEVFHNLLLDKLKPGNNQKRDDINKYILPSLNGIYEINEKNNFKASYYKAINKPSFLEIVPYIDNTGDYPKVGNPDLKNAVADNYDLRYEYFPNKLDQILIGSFYKKINNAIEEGFSVDGHGNYNLTSSNSNAVNYGLEADFIKFYREIGIKANYTWTHSLTSSYKRSQVNGVVNRDSTISTLQYRPLCGQAENVGNISLLYKGTHNGLNAQLAFSYTGDRIYKVSPDINGDLWQKGFWQLDLSAEKKLKHGFGVFVKARNLLNTQVNVFLKQKNPYNNQFPYQLASDNNTLLRDEYSQPSYLIGIRYKLN
jgi:outer membrane receptor protein involved in Fe transport